MLAWHNSPDLSALHSPDTHTYVLPSQSLLSQGTFSRYDHPEVVRTPGYSLFLMPGILSGHLEIVTVAMQMIISVTTVWLVYRLTGQLTGSHYAAVCAGLFAAVEPLSIIYTCYLLPETVYTFLLVLSLTWLVSYLRTSRFRDVTISGLLLAVATFIRPVSYFLPAGLVLLLLIQAWWRSGQRLRTIAYACTFGAVCMTPLCAWQLRNYAVTGYSGFSAVTDSNLYFFQAAAVLAAENGKPLKEMQAELGYFDRNAFDELHPELLGAGQAEKFRYMHSKAIHIIGQDTLRFARIYFRGLGLLVLNPAASDVLRLGNLYPEKQRLRPIDLGIFGILNQLRREAPLVFYTNLCMAGLLGLLYLGSFAAAPALLRNFNWQWTILAATTAYFLAVSSGATSVARLRHPVMPIICVLAGLGMATAFKWLCHKPKKLLLIPQSLPSKASSQAA